MNPFLFNKYTKTDNLVRDFCISPPNDPFRETLQLVLIFELVSSKERDKGPADFVTIRHPNHYNEAEFCSNLEDFPNSLQRPD